MDAEKEGTFDKDRNGNEANTIAGVERGREEQVNCTVVGELVTPEGARHDVQDENEVVSNISKLMDVEGAENSGRYPDGAELQDYITLNIGAVFRPNSRENRQEQWYHKRDLIIVKSNYKTLRKRIDVHLVVCVIVIFSTYIVVNATLGNPRRNRVEQVSVFGFSQFSAIYYNNVHC